MSHPPGSHGKNGSSAPATPIPSLDVSAQFSGARLLICHEDLYADVAQALAMNRALWPATLDTYLKELVATRLPTSTKAEIERFFLTYVTGRNLLPAMRVGSQPYGVLATSDLRRWREPPRDGAGPTVLDGLRYFRAQFEQLEPGIAQMGRSTEPLKTTMRVIGQQASSVGFGSRKAVTDEIAWKTLMFKGTLPLVLNNWFAQLEARRNANFASLGIDRANLPLAALVYFGQPDAFTGPIIDQDPDLPLSERQTLTRFDGSRNYMFNAAQDPGSLWWGAIAAGMRGSVMAVKSTAALPNNWDSMFAFDPEQSINYVSAHDNLDLWDKITFAGATGGAAGYAGRVDKFAMGMVLTSQGIPFVHAGDELLRSKAFNGDYATAKNSYNASDDYNMIRWADLQTNAAVNAYYRDAIALRKATPALRLTTWDDVRNRMRTSINAGANNAAAINVVHDPGLPASVVVSLLASNPAQPTTYDVAVVYNPGNAFSLALPAGAWTKVFDINGAVSKTDTTCEGTAVTVFKR